MWRQWNGDDDAGALAGAAAHIQPAAHGARALLQTAQAEGFGAQWLTGWLAYDRPFLEHTLGLHADEQLLGTLAIGTATVAVPERERPDVAALLTDWQP